ncbi:hypothetical protein [Schlesneria paludicola]|uniref:hypothetical protein n=1 Tax=Schlesneria paludicola TaxID=360056 RepID=UPI00029A7FC1|nr:hypothetical protein [Schlesneria paludicola]
MSKSSDKSTPLDKSDRPTRRFSLPFPIPRRVWIGTAIAFGVILFAAFLWWLMARGGLWTKSATTPTSELIDVPARSSSDGPRLRSTAERSQDPSDNLIILGTGTRRLRIGATARSIVEMMGRPDDVLRSDSGDGFHVNAGVANYVDPTHWLVYKESGVALIESGGRIESIVFRFRNRTFVSFDGATDKGIGMWSTVNDVIRAYGNPDRIEKGYKYLKGIDTAEHDFSYLLHYTSRATVFTFRNGELQAIVVGKW